MSAVHPGGQVRVQALVRVAPADAFELFTTCIDQWWRRGPRFRHAGRRAGLIHIEPRLGGRLFESFDAGGDEPRVVEVGHVTAWAPPALLAFSWRNANFAPHETTEVEVRFDAAGDSATQVTVVHRGWASIRDDHPVRHGLASAAFLQMMGMWWGEQLGSLRRLSSAEPTS